MPRTQKRPHNVFTEDPLQLSETEERNLRPWSFNTGWARPTTLLQPRSSRVGELAHGPLRNRCPRAAPNPSLGGYAGLPPGSLLYRNTALGRLV